MWNLLEKLNPPPVWRRRLYALWSVAAPLLVAYGYLNGQVGALWAAAIGTVLGGGMAAGNVTPGAP